MAAGRLVLIQGSGQSASPGGVFANPVIFQVFDTNNVPMPGLAMTWTAPGSQPSGTFVSTGTTTFTSVTDANGYCRSNPGVVTDSNIQAGSGVGTWVGTVAPTATPAVTGNWYFTNELAASTASLLTIVAGDNQKAALNTAYAAPLVVQITDQNGFDGPQASVIFTALAGHGTFPGGLTTATVLSSPTGLATSPVFTANGVAGPFTIGAGVVGSAAVTATGSWENVDATIPTILTVESGSNQTTPLSTLYPLPLKAKVLNGLLLPLAGFTVTFTSPAAGASCTFPTLFSTTTVVSDGSGIATSPTPLANATAGSYFVTATLSGASGAQFSLKNGLSYSPEVCSTSVAPLSGTNQGSNPVAWGQPVECISTTSGGAYVSLDIDEASKVLLASPAPSTSFVGIADDAVITKFVVTFQTKTRRISSFIPQGQFAIYNGTTARSAAIGMGNAETETWASKGPVNMAISAPTLLGAALKAGNFGVGFYSSTSGIEGGVLYVRAVKFSICYQNPAAAPATLDVPLQICEA